MNIEISTNEYRDLLDILHITDVVLSGHRREPDRRSERHRALIQKLYALAKGEGLDLLMSHDASTGAHTPTREFEERSVAHLLINEFGDHIFWDALISRLTIRDAARAAGGMDRLNALHDDARETIETPIRQSYIEEFAKNGIANLAVIDGFVVGGQGPVKTSD